MINNNKFKGHCPHDERIKKLMETGDIYYLNKALLQAMQDIIK